MHHFHPVYILSWRAPASRRRLRPLWGIADSDGDAKRVRRSRRRGRGSTASTSSATTPPSPGRRQRTENAGEDSTKKRPRTVGLDVVDLKGIHEGEGSCRPEKDGDQNGAGTMGYVGSSRGKLGQAKRVRKSRHPAIKALHDLSADRPPMQASVSFSSTNTG